MVLQAQILQRHMDRRSALTSSPPNVLFQTLHREGKAGRPVNQRWKLCVHRVKVPGGLVIYVGAARPRRTSPGTAQGGGAQHAAGLLTFVKLHFQSAAVNKYTFVLSDYKYCFGKIIPIKKILKTDRGQSVFEHTPIENRQKCTVGSCLSPLSICASMHYI